MPSWAIAPSSVLLANVVVNAPVNCEVYEAVPGRLLNMKPLDELDTWKLLVLLRLRTCRVSAGSCLELDLAVSGESKEPEIWTPNGQSYVRETPQPLKNLPLGCKALADFSQHPKPRDGPQSF